MEIIAYDKYTKVKKLTRLRAGIVLPVILAISFLLFLPQKTYSQSGPECMKIFDKEMKDCTTKYNACSDACMKEGEKPDGTAYFNAGEIYPKCMKASQCHERSSSCSEQALTNYKACGKPSKQSEAKAAKKETPKQGRLPVFIGEWFRLMSSGIDLLISEVQLDNTFNQIFSEGDKPSEFTPEWFEMKGREFKKLRKELGLSPVEPPAGSTVEANSEPKTIKQGSATIQVAPQSQEPGLLDMYPKPFLRSGKVDVIVEPQDGAQFEMQTEFLDLLVVGTEFSVIQDNANKRSIVAVYQGKVKVKTKDGRTTTITPDGDKPGVVVVSRKLSVTKLAVLGGVLVAIIGGAAFMLKRKFTATGLNRKKR